MTAYHNITRNRLMGSYTGNAYSASYLIRRDGSVWRAALDIASISQVAPRLRALYPATFQARSLRDVSTRLSGISRAMEQVSCLMHSNNA